MKEYILKPIMTPQTVNRSATPDKPVVARTLPPRRQKRRKQKAGRRLAGVRRAGLPAIAPSEGWFNQQMERTFGAITLSNQAAPSPRLSPFQSFGGLGRVRLRIKFPQRILGLPNSLNVEEANIVVRIAAFP